METIQIKLEKQTFDDATLYARRKGIDLATMIEDYLSRIVRKKKMKSEDIPDIVQSLLGAGEPVADDDLNAREAYYKYLEEKYR
jgi:(2Fe-2S) ferredoxin